MEGRKKSQMIALFTCLFLLFISIFGVYAEPDEEKTQSEPQTVEENVNTTQENSESNTDKINEIEENKSTENIIESTPQNTVNSENLNENNGTQTLSQETVIDVPNLKKGEIPTEGSYVQVKGKDYYVRYIYDESPIFSGGGEIIIDGEFNDWGDKPYVFEYGSTNTYVEYVFNPDTNQYEAQYYLNETGGVFNNLIRNKISLFRDDTYIYLYVKIAGNYKNGFESNNWNFLVNETSNQKVEFVINEIANNNSGGISLAQGTYLDSLCVRHNSGKLSGQIVEDAQVAFVRTTDDGSFDELECRIPLTAFGEQNAKIDLDNMSIISVNQPNLMKERFTISGTSTGPYLGILICFILISVFFFIQKRRKKA